MDKPVAHGTLPLFLVARCFFFLFSFNSVDKVVPTVVSSTATACRRVGLTCVSIVLGLSEDALWMKVHLLAGHGWADAGDAAWRQRL